MFAHVTLKKMVEHYGRKNLNYIYVNIIYNLHTWINNVVTPSYVQYNRLHMRPFNFPLHLLMLINNGDREIVEGLLEGYTYKGMFPGFCDFSQIQLLI